MKSTIDMYEKALCRKVADVFEIAGKRGYPVVLFTRIWFSSEHCDGLFHNDLYSVAQSPLYQFNSLLLECPDIKEYEGTEFGYKELMYWAGYIFSYWIFSEKTTWKELSSQYDYELMMRNYDCLHTLLPEHAIDIAKTEYNRTKLAKEKIFQKK